MNLRYKYFRAILRRNYGLYPVSRRLVYMDPDDVNKLNGAGFLDFILPVIHRFLPIIITLCFVGLYAGFGSVKAQDEDIDESESESGDLYPSHPPNAPDPRIENSRESIERYLSLLERMGSVEYNRYDTSVGCKDQRPYSTWHVWEDGNNIRIGDHPLSLDGDTIANSMGTINISGGVVYETRTDIRGFKQAAFANRIRNSGTAKIVGEAVVGKDSCIIVEYSIDDSTSRCWISGNSGMILRQETSRPTPQGTCSSTIFFNDFVMKPISPSIFEIKHIPKKR